MNPFSFSSPCKSIITSHQQSWRKYFEIYVFSPFFCCIFRPFDLNPESIIIQVEMSCLGGGGCLTDCSLTALANQIKSLPLVALAVVELEICVLGEHEITHSRCHSVLHLFQLIPLARSVSQSLTHHTLTFLNQIRPFLDTLAFTDFFCLKQFFCYQKLINGRQSRHCFMHCFPGKNLVWYPKSL